MPLSFLPLVFLTSEYMGEGRMGERVKSNGQKWKKLEDQRKKLDPELFDHYHLPPVTKITNIKCLFKNG